MAGQCGWGEWENFPRWPCFAASHFTVVARVTICLGPPRRSMAELHLQEASATRRAGAGGPPARAVATTAVAIRAVRRRKQVELALPSSPVMVGREACRTRAVRQG